MIINIPERGLLIEVSRLTDAADIPGVEASGRCTRVVGAGGSQFCNLSIGDIEARLGAEPFMRVHRDTLVNLRAVGLLLREDGRPALRLPGNDASIPVSRSSAAGLLERPGLPGGVPITARQG